MKRKVTAYLIGGPCDGHEITLNYFCQHLEVPKIMSDGRIGCINYYIYKYWEKGNILKLSFKYGYKRKEKA